VLALALLAAMRGEIKRLDGRQLLWSLVKFFAAGAAMYGVARGGLWLMGPGDGLVDSAVVLICVGGAALATYSGTSLLLKVEELGSAATLLRRLSARA
jgi:hypothetical protein